ncbi:MAG TPA: hypothetical protein VNZ05_03510, partial [Solirubrobacteraceae bacterium]|nr:hypothetical protein [Solirubrobacteraceae bacterium]
MHRLPARLRCLFRLSLALAALVLLLAAPSAAASKLRRLVPNVVAFASDDTRYIAWESPGQKAVFVLDTRTGHRLAFKVGCALSDKTAAASGRFLLECPKEQALLDVHTGKVTPLPTPPPREIGEYGPIWEGVGSRYV